MSSFCICKSYSHFFSKNTCELYIVLTRTILILTTNELVKLTMLWTIGPWYIIQRSRQWYQGKFFLCYSMNTYVVGTLWGTSNDYPQHMFSRKNKKIEKYFFIVKLALVNLSDTYIKKRESYFYFRQPFSV